MFAQQIRTKVENATDPGDDGRESTVHSSVSGWERCIRHHLAESNAGLVRHMEGGAAVLWIPVFLLVGLFRRGVHEVLQGEGGEQGDALMPALFSLGQHDAVVTMHGRLAPDERLLAVLDDVYAVGDRPERSGAAYAAIQEDLRPTLSSRCTRGRHSCSAALRQLHGWPTGNGSNSRVVKSRVTLQ